MSLTHSPGPPLEPGSRAAGCVFALLGSTALVLGLGLLAFGGVLQWMTGLTEAQTSRLAALPVVRTVGDLNNLPPGAELLLEGRVKRALVMPGDSLPAMRRGLLAWYEARFVGREVVTAGQSHEVWATVDTVCPTLAIKLRGSDEPVLIAGGYRLLEPLLQIQSDTPAARPSPRTGPRGSWRYSGLRAGAHVTVMVRKTSAAVGDSLPMRADELRAGSADDWYDAEAARHRFGVGFSWGLVALGGVLTLVGAGILVVGWRQRRAARQAALSTA